MGSVLRFIRKALTKASLRENPINGDHNRPIPSVKATSDEKVRRMGGSVVGTGGKEKGGLLKKLAGGTDKEQIRKRTSILG